MAEGEAKGGSRQRLLIWLIVAALPAFTTASAAAKVPKPRILKVTVTPSELPPNGGWVTIEARVRHAKSCTVLNTATHSRRAACRSGVLRLREHVPLNEDNVAETFAVTVVAHGRDGRARSRDAKLEVESSYPAPPNVRYLDQCPPGPECDYGYAYEQFRTWGNNPSEALGDCTFAAAANWEQMIDRRTPSEAEVAADFAQAGGGPAGLTMAVLWAYWKRYGIGGTTLTAETPYQTEPGDVESAVRAQGALLVQLNFLNDYGFGYYTMKGAGSHVAVVVGFTTVGPLVVTWGETLRMTWEQWRSEIAGMWAIETTPSA